MPINVRTGNRSSNPQDNDVLAKRVQALHEASGPEAVMATLTPKQARFAEEFVKTYDRDEAMILAGYNIADKRNAAKAAHNLVQHPAVKIAVAYLTEIRAKELAAIDVPYVEQKWLEIVEAMHEKTLKGDTKAAAVLLRTTEIMARALGMFVDRQEITGRDGEAIQIEEINDAANAFTRSIARLNERDGEGSLPVVTRH